MVNENDRPPVAPQEEINDDQPPMMGGGMRKIPNMGGGSSLIRTAVVALVVTLVVVLVVNMTGQMWVSKTTFDTNLGNVAATIDQMKTADKATTDKVKDIPTTTSINTSVADAVSKATSGVSTQLGTLTTTVNGFSQKINDASTQASSAVNQINSMNGQIASLKADNEALKKQVSDLKSGGGSSGISTTDYNNLVNDVKNLKSDVATLKSSGGGTSTTITGGGGSGVGGSSSGTGTATSADGKTKVSIISYSYTNIFGGNTSAPAVLTFTPQRYDPPPTQTTPNTTKVSIPGSSDVIWLNNTTSQNFQMQIQNNTGKTITDIQISLAFMWIKSDGTQISLPSYTTYSMSSMGNPQWTNTANDPTYTAWMTGSSNSVLGSIWSFSQAPGTTSYYSSLTIALPVSSNTTAPLSMPALSWYAVPIVKVISYNLQ